MPDPLIDESAPLAVKLIRDRSVLICLLVQASTKLALRDREILELQDYLGQIGSFLDEEEREPKETVEAIRNELNGLESERDAALARVRELEAHHDLCAYSANPDDGCRFCGGMWPFSGPCPGRLGKIAELESRIRELTESNARLLADLGNSSARIQELQEGNDMACESPPVVAEIERLREENERLKSAFEAEHATVSRLADVIRCTADEMTEELAAALEGGR